jgi:hypothetical protein
MLYKNKYLKYKNLYLNLKNLSGGAASNLASEASASASASESSELEEKPKYSYYYMTQFIYSCRDPTDYDKLLSDKKISNVDTRDPYNKWSALHWIQNKKKFNYQELVNNLLYLLTFDHPANVNGVDDWNTTPLWRAAENRNLNMLKLLIDFGGDREIKSINDVATPLDVANFYNDTKMITLLTEYFPSEEEKLLSQIASKKIIDSIFKDKGIPRFKQNEIDLKYESLKRCLDAVTSENLENLIQSLPHIDLRMTLSLTQIAIDMDKNLLIPHLLKKLIDEKVFEKIKDKSVEPIVYIGVDADPTKVDPDLINIINRSRVLSLFKILYHKYIYLGVDTIFQLIQTLIHEKVFNKKE